MSNNRVEKDGSSGFTRRKVLQMGTGLAVAGTLGAMASRIPAYAQAPARHVKPLPPEFFIDHSLNQESRPEKLKGLLTANSLFFIRNHDVTPVIDAKTYRLKVEGSSVSKLIELTYDDIFRLPFKTVFTWVECAGNGRSFFGTFLRSPASGTQWRFGAIGAAEWTGVPLSIILDLAGLKPGAVDVLLEGLDGPKVNRPIPIEKALDPNTILAYSMNGEPLPPDHGFPIRAITPGWVGINNTKWLGRIQVEDKRIEVTTNTRTYILAGPDYPDKPALSTQNIKSSVGLPWDGTIEAGQHLIRGFAWSAHGKIASLEYSMDGGPWGKATLEESRDSLLWQRWSFNWRATAGRHYIATRATDEKGNSQPYILPKFNEQGYLYNTIVSHPFNVV